jgi:hypothetical protein
MFWNCHKIMLLEVTELLPCFQVVNTGEEKKSGCTVEPGNIDDTYSYQRKNQSFFKHSNSPNYQIRMGIQELSTATVVSYIVCEYICHEHIWIESNSTQDLQFILSKSYSVSAYDWNGDIKFKRTYAYFNHSQELQNDVAYKNMNNDIILNMR